MKTLRELIHPPTYARARLHLGIGGVGTFVVLALIALATGLPTRIFGPRGGDPYTDASLFAVWLTGVAFLCLPFEYLGGYYLPRYFRRRHPVQSEWALSWVRGVLVLAKDSGAECIDTASALKLKSLREAYSEALAGFDALEHALKRGYIALSS